jgi:Na+/melibiose symporter-like transporter
MVNGLAGAGFLPRLVGPERLVEANARLELSRTGAQVAGPGLAGALVQLLTAPLAIALDGLSFFVSAATLGLIRAPEPPPRPRAEGDRFWADLRAGLALVLGHRLLRPLVGASALLFFSNDVFEAVSLLYLTRELGLPPALLGVVFAVGNVGFMLGALTVRRVSARLGVGTTLVAGALAAGLTDLIAPLLGFLPPAAVAPLPTAAALMASGLLFGLSVIAFNVSSASLRQSATPDEMQARVAGTTQFLTGGLGPLAAVVGGLLGQTIGLQATLFLAVAGELVAAVLLLLSPLRTVKDLSERPNPS